MTIAARHVTIVASDGFPLAATVYSPAAANERLHVVVIASAAGVRRRFYRDYAIFLAQHGFAVVSFDYRGIGDSQPVPIHRLNAQLHQWGESDLASVIEWIAASYPDHTLFGLCHSIGGQLIGIAENNWRLKALMTVGAQSGYWKLWRGTTKAALWFLWHVAMPALTSLYSYFPAKQLGLGESLPRGMALEWARWSRDPAYLFGECSRPSAMNFRQIRAPIRAYSFADDRFAPKRAVQALHAAFTEASIEHKHVRPVDIGQKAIGHFNFFRDACRATLWRDSVDWLTAQASRPSDRHCEAPGNFGLPEAVSPS
jgi:predicted alpha/beta hydrolase